MGGAEPRLGGPARLVFGLSLAAYIAAAEPWTALGMQ